MVERVEDSFTHKTLAKKDERYRHHKKYSQNNHVVISIQSSVIAPINKV